MTDVHAEALRKVRQEDREQQAERVETVAAEMEADARAARAGEAALKQRVKQLAAVEQTKQAILEATGGAMVAVRVLVAKLREVFVLYAQLRDQTKDLRGRISADWSPFQIITRYGYLLGAELSKVAGLANALGTVKWSLHGNYAAGADWVEAEKKILDMRTSNDDSA